MLINSIACSSRLCCLGEYTQGIQCFQQANNKEEPYMYMLCTKLDSNHGWHSESKSLWVQFCHTTILNTSHNTSSIKALGSAVGWVKPQFFQPSNNLITRSCSSDFFSHFAKKRSLSTGFESFKYLTRTPIPIANIGDFISHNAIMWTSWLFGYFLDN